MGVEESIVHDPRHHHPPRRLQRACEAGEEVKERPILFKGEMVRAILGGRKTQTRRIAKHERILEITHTVDRGETVCWYGSSGPAEQFSPYKVGDRLWVKETFSWCAGGMAWR